MSESHPSYRQPGKQGSCSSMKKKQKTLHELKVIFKTVVALEDPSDESEVNMLLLNNMSNIVDDEILDDALVTIVSPIKEKKDLPHGWNLEGIPYTFDGCQDLVTIKEYLDPSIPVSDCPFCGTQMSEKNVSEWVDHGESPSMEPITMYSLKCRECGAGFNGTSKMSVIMRWNKRSSQE
jgi:hypothetical protein